jgi:hypothetical protein
MEDWRLDAQAAADHDGQIHQCIQLTLNERIQRGGLVSMEYSNPDYRLDSIAGS